MEWESIIGLEVHVSLSTKSKLFSGTASTFGAEPNTQANIFDLALPGTLPAFNENALQMAVFFGLAIGAKIGKRSIFDRKNYFYPDLPKGYQVTQLDFPTVGKGSLTISLEDGTEKVIGVTRAHIEENAGKSLHEEFTDQSGIDLNRAGEPLLEIVSEPEIKNAKEAVAYLKKLHSIVRYLDISDAIMAQGSMRCDVNVSIRKKGDNKLGTRTEIKNINSFRFVEKAINSEIIRQQEVIEDGGTIIQETRRYDANKDITSSMRSKEVANDYRYFPEPDLLPIVIDDSYISSIQSALPELPDAKQRRFISDYGLSKYDAGVLTATRELAEYFEQVAKKCGDAKSAANWVTGSLLALLNKDDIEIIKSPIDAERLASLIGRIKDNTISGKIAKNLFEIMATNFSSVDELIEKRGLKQVTDVGEIEKLITKVLNDNPNQVQQFADGKEQVLGFLIGQAMKASQGKANPEQVNELLKEKIKQKR
ncbi:MAG: Asp-tRNA(Asn)/Glu-tRNA(Gln) amidotransferase subunit GatB [Gammaproteobacteria bacterium]|nr:Asp-tRNA(Asn)/Glu-tRNA(Gln) amidotransferase subunit GatB [Gammaproteobacteria bacterium]